MKCSGALGVALAFCLSSAAEAQPWSRSYSGFGQVTVIHSVAAGSDGRLLVSVSRTSPESCLLAIDKAGESPRGLCSGYHNGAIVLADGYLVFGAEGPESRREIRVGTISRLDLDMKMVWRRRVVGPEDVHLKAAAAATDGSFVVVGSHGPAAFVMKLNADGTIGWQHRYELTEQEEFLDVAAMANGFVVAGTGRHQPWVARLDRDGLLVWQTFAPPYGNARAVVPHASGGVVVGGFVLNDRRSTVPWLALIDGRGSMVWQRKGDAGAVVERLTTRPDGSIIALTSSAARAEFMAFDRAGEVMWQTGFQIEPPYRATALPNGFVLARAVASGSVEIYRLDERGKGDTCVSRMSRDYKTAFTEAAGTEIYDLDRLPGGVAVGDAMIAGNDAAVMVQPATCEPLPNRTPPPQHTVGGSRADEVLKRTGIEQSEFRQTVKQMLWRREFDALDRMADELRKSRETFDTGYSKLTVYYEGLGFIEEDQTQAAHMALFDEWRKARPRSAAAVVGAAVAMIHWADRTRGPGFVDTVSESAGQKYLEIVRAATNLLDQSAAFAATDPEYWRARAELAGMTCTDLDRVVRQAGSREKRHPQIFRDAALFYLPRWCGSTTEFRKFAEYAADATKAHYGDALYALVSWTAIEFESEGENALTTFGLDWRRMRRGFEDYLKKYPEATIWHQRFAYAAWRAQDRQVARRLFSTWHLGYGPAADVVWKSHHEYMQVRDWAMRELPAGTGSPTPEMPSTVLRQPPASPWVLKPAAQWPLLVLAGELKLRDGSVHRNLNSFLVNTGKGVVAITVAPASSERPSQSDYVRGLSVDQLISQMTSWTMRAPSKAQPTLTVTSINKMSPRHLSRALVLTVKVSTPEMPVRVHEPAKSSRDLSPPVYVVTCKQTDKGCRQTVYTVTPAGSAKSGGREFGRLSFKIDSNDSLDDLAGSPVIDDAGVVVGVMTGDKWVGGPGFGPVTPLYHADEIGLVLEHAGIWEMSRSKETP